MILTDCDELTQSLVVLDRDLAGRETIFTQRTVRVAELNQEVSGLNQEINLLTQTNQALLFISSKVLSQSTEVIDRLVTAGLRVVFDDTDFQFKTRIERLRGRTALCFDLYQDGHTVPLVDSYGGGVKCIVGFLMRVVTIIVLNLRRILILDEALADLHGQRYIENAGTLFRKIAKELDFTILAICDQQGFSVEADHHYIASASSDGLGIARAAGQERTDKAST